MDGWKRHLIVGPMRLPGVLHLPMNPRGVVIFAHGGGSSHLSPRNNHVADVLAGHRLASMLADLLTPGEAGLHENVFNIRLLAERLIQIIEGVAGEEEVRALPIGLFGASTGAAAALVAAARLGERIACVVSRGGRPDLAQEALGQVKCPTLLIVGSYDPVVLGLNRRAKDLFAGQCELVIVPGAGHLFEEAGTLDVAAARAADWFEKFM